jgi:trk system potassium uptake protein TrkH
MNFNVVFKIIGFLLFIIGLFMLAGIPFSLYYGSDDIPALLISGLGTSLVGSIMWLTNKLGRQDDITTRDGYLIVTLGWMFASLFGSLPFLIHGSIPGITDAIFESVSGFTTTGASILNNVEAVPYGLLFWRSMTHWLGGMGIIVLSLAILPLLRIGGMSLYKAEVAGPSKDKLHPRVQETSKRLWAIYVLLTLAETILLMFGGMNLFDALCHSFGTLASGGFSTKNASVAFYHSPFIEYVVIVFMFLAGTNFTLHYLALKGNPLNYFKDSEFRFYFVLVILVVIGAALYLDFYNKQPWELSLRNSAFSVISVLSSTGFVIGDYEKWAPFFSQIFLVLLLFGACAGSTSGGVKMVRYQILLKNSLLELKKLIHPNAVLPVRQNNRAVSNDIISKISAFVILYLFIFLIGSVILSIIGLELSSAMGAVAACLGNIGPGLGSTGPANTYANVPFLGKWVLSFIMLLGRLELFTILILFSPSFWKN